MYCEVTAEVTTNEPVVGSLVVCAVRRDPIASAARESIIFFIGVLVMLV